LRDFLDVQHGHSAVGGELPQILRAAMDSDLDRPLGIQHAVEHGIAKRTTVMKLGALERAAGIAMRVDMNHAHGPLSAQRLENRIGDRMIAAYGERDYAGRADVIEKHL